MAEKSLKNIKLSDISKVFTDSDNSLNVVTSLDQSLLKKNGVGGGYLGRIFVLNSEQSGREQYELYKIVADPNDSTSEIYQDIDLYDVAELKSRLSNLSQSTYISLLSRLQIIKPVSTQSLQVHITVSTSQEFSSVLFSIDSSTEYSKFKGYSISNGRVNWNQITSEGFGLSYNNLPILVDLGTNLTNSGIELNSSTILYVKYYWYYIENNEEHRSDEYSTILPSNTEVGANSQDTVGKLELADYLIGKADKSYVDDQLSTKLDISYAEENYASSLSVCSLETRVCQLETLVGTANQILEEV